jgi:DNA-binding beta-propeller fold protein YncE
VVSLYARDASGLTSQTISSSPDSVRFYGIVNRPATTPLALSQNYTNDMVYDAKRDLMYVGLQGDTHILVLSPSTMTLQSPIVLTGAPMGMDLSLSGDSLLVAVPSANTVAVVDLNNPSAAAGAIRLSVLDTTALSSGVPVAPSGLRIAANGKMLVMLTNMTAHGDQTVEVDLTTGAQRIRADARGLSTWSAYWTQFMGRNDDRSRIYVLGMTCWSWYAASSDTFKPCGSGVYTDYMGMTFDAAGTHMTRGASVFDADTHALWGSGPINQIYPYAAMSPDGASVYLGAGQGITTMRFADKTMLERVPIPVRAERLFLGPSGAWMLVFQNANGSRVTRVDLR